MIFNCRLQILRAKPINALIAFPPRLSGVGGETQCIVGIYFFIFLFFYVPECRLIAAFLSQKPRRYEADALAQRRYRQWLPHCTSTFQIV